jgi:uridine kinase
MVIWADLFCEIDGIRYNTSKSVFEEATVSARPVIVGVSGGTASGKTTIFEAVLDRVGRDKVAFIQHDAYYVDLSHLPVAERRKVNFDHPDALESGLLVAHLDALRRGKAVEVPVYDFSTYVRWEQTRRVEPKPVILVEGILIFAERELRRQFDIKIYVDADADLRFIRRLQRDIAERGRTMEAVIEQYLETVRPMHLEFVEPSKRYADVIIPTGGFNPIAIDMVSTKIMTMIGNRDG